MISYFKHYVYRGSFAIVKSGVNKKTGERVAVKIIERYSSISFILQIDNLWKRMTKWLYRVKLTFSHSLIIQML
jgi:hypothetical protein